MRPQPSIEIVLQRAAESLQDGAAKTSDAALADLVLSPVASLLRVVAASFDTYVADRLAEIDRLAALAADADAFLGGEYSGQVNPLLDAARKASGYVPAAKLDDLADALQRELVAAQERIETRQDPASRELAERIWAEQTAKRGARAARW
jgi:hypothetical protein